MTRKSVWSPTLRLRESDADHVGAVLLGGADREAAPAATDVEHPLARLDRQLAGDGVELHHLRLLERLRVALGEVRAAVGHRLVEEEPEELVGDVVVVADGAGVALLAVAAAGRDELGGGARRRHRQSGGADRGEGQGALVGAVQRGRLPAVEQGDRGVDVIDLQLPGDVGAAEPELARGAERVGGGAGRADGEGRALAGGGGKARSVPELDRERAVGKARGELAAQ
jgi:hypothetical protein